VSPYRPPANCLPLIFLPITTASYEPRSPGGVSLFGHGTAACGPCGCKSATKEEIVHNYRRKIQRCHPDRVAGLAPEFLELAEERSKALNAAYAQAMRVQRRA
jgi:hypothetical protein